MYIIGTAGHVDHGKSSLVEALTGSNPDRLPQEKERSLTIVLGFASYTNARNQRIGIIDVPGHERFIRNMVSGIWSLDLALLIVAADDGWMEQTEDHAAILKAMGVTEIIVVITKADLVDVGRLATVTEEVALHFEAIFDRRPPVVVTSAPSGLGIEALKRAVDATLAQRLEHPFPPALCIDRSFIIDGIGAVATGSLRGQTLQVGEQVTLLPSGVKAKVRTIQCYGEAAQRAGDGTRVALSLQGITKEQLPTGEVITTTPSFYRTSRRVHLLVTPIRTGERLKLKRVGEVEIASATWHDWATMHITGDREGETLLATLTLEEVRPWYSGESVVLIRNGSSKVLAKGTVITAAELEKGGLRSLAAIVARCNGLPPSLATEADFFLHLNGYGKNADHGAVRMIEGEAFIRLGPWYLKQSQLEACAQKLAGDLDVRHSLPLQTFKQESGLPLELAELVAYHLVEGKQARLVGANLEAAVQQSALSADEEALLKKIEGQGFEGYPVKWIAKEERTTITSLRQKQEILIVEGSFVYSERTFAEIVSRILKGKAVGTTFTIADARQHLDLSRKYMIPLLNTLEDRGYVQRMGDVRRVLALPGEKGRTL